MPKELVIKTADIKVNLAGIKGNLPMQVQLLDSNLKLQESQWAVKKDFTFENVTAGQYMIRVSLTSGKDLSQLVKVSGRSKSIKFTDNPEANLASVGVAAVKEVSKLKGGGKIGYTGKNITLKSQRFHGKGLDKASKFSQEDLFYFQKNADTGPVLKSTQVIESKYKIVSTVYEYGPAGFRKLRRNAINWLAPSGAKRKTKIQTSSHKCLLILEFATAGSRAILCPPNATIGVEIKASGANSGEKLKFDVLIYTDNSQAEGLMGLINSGSMLEAKSFVNANLAERLLYEKVNDPVGAAVGGYFLLKIKDLDRMHHWAANLANWFSWMPDGQIIYAWQMMSQPNANTNFETIRDYVLSSYNSGIPLYTEGLRLQFEALIQLSAITKGKDAEVEVALNSLQNWIGQVDWSKKNTTIEDIAFDEHGLPSKRLTFNSESRKYLL